MEGDADADRVSADDFRVHPRRARHRGADASTPPSRSSWAPSTSARRRSPTAASASPAGEAVADAEAVGVEGGWQLRVHLRDPATTFLDTDDANVLLWFGPAVVLGASAAPPVDEVTFDAVLTREEVELFVDLLDTGSKQAGSALLVEGPGPLGEVGAAHQLLQEPLALDDGGADVAVPVGVELGLGGGRATPATPPSPSTGRTRGAGQQLVDRPDLR